jgi:hypothetical protein
MDGGHCIGAETKSPSGWTSEKGQGTNPLRGKSASLEIVAFLGGVGESLNVLA